MVYLTTIYGECIVLWITDSNSIRSRHDDVIKWKHFPCYWPFVRGIHRSPVSSPHKGQWRGALMFSLICAWINSWVNNPETGDLRCHRANYDVIVMHGVDIVLPEFQHHKIKGLKRYLGRPSRCSVIKNSRTVVWGKEAIYKASFRRLLWNFIMSFTALKYMIWVYSEIRWYSWVLL